MPKINPLSFERVSQALAYDALTGEFTWLISPAKNIKVGARAGCPKGARLNKTTGKIVRYVYIRLDNIDTPAARVAWLLHYGEWPEGNILFADGDSENLRISNLRKGTTIRITTGSDGKKSVKMTKEAQRNYGLKRFYGLTGEQYGAKLAAQHGLCAICGKPETVIVHGSPKAMSVDHDHETGSIRDLLCNACNHGLGHFGDDPIRLRAAADYIDRHRSTETVVSFPRGA